MSNLSFHTITGESEGLFKDRGSKFIARCFPVETEEDVKAAMAGLRKEFYDARHHCYAFRLGANKDVYRYSDDGEPANSAGAPIYGQIQSFDLTNVLVVVVRYFGGVKLGVGGLINAYREATKIALEEANITEKFIRDYYQVRFGYDQTSSAMRLLNKYNCEIKDQVFEADCLVLYSIDPLKAKALNEEFDLLELKNKYLETR